MANDEVTEELQSKFAFLERTVETLSQVVIEQGNEIGVLRQRIERFESRLQVQGEGDAERDPLEERPPHY